MQRKPVLVVVGVTAVLALTGLPFLGATYLSGDYRTLPRGTESRDVTDTLRSQFPGGQATAPVTVVARVDAASPAFAHYPERIVRLPGVLSAMTMPDPAHGLTVVQLTPEGTSQGEVAQNLVHELRAQRPSFPTYVTGEAAFLVDFTQSLPDRLPLALGLIGAVTFVLLFLMTGSVLIPLKALVMNVLSLAATFGAIVLVFQDGHLSGPLGFYAFRSIEAWVPLVVFVFAFGLSMDYEVFLLSRIKEAHDAGLDTDRAVAVGLQRSGRIITSAALLVMIVFLGFAAGRNLGVKEMGLALAIAVVVDATLVRCLLVPATMSLLGSANWWAPSWARRVYARFGLHEAPEVVRPQPEPIHQEMLAATTGPALLGLPPRV